MAVSVDHCRISLSATVHSRGAAGRNPRGLVKFCNGEVMGKKLQLSQVQQGAANCIKNKKNGRVCMSLSAADVVGEAKVSFL